MDGSLPCRPRGATLSFFWARKANVRVWRLGLAFCGLALLSCSRPSDQAVSAYQEQVARWLALNTRPAGVSAIRLRDDTCLDTRRLQTPWVAAAPASAAAKNPGLEIEATAEGAGLVPFNGGADDWGRPKDGKVRVSVVGWSRPSNDNLANWTFASPARIEQLIGGADPNFKRLSLWPDDVGLEAYPRTYLDKRRLTQCRDYGPSTPLIWCSVVSNDEMFSYNVRLDPKSLPRLPQGLGSITQALEKARGPCV
jgi:hypothetical protein